MKSIVFNNTGNPSDVLSMQIMPVPEPGNGEILICMKAMPFNPSDEMYIKGNYRKKPVLPQIAGLEGAGIVEKVGNNVLSIVPGMKVAFRSTGTWADFCIVKQEEVIILDQDISWDAACQITLNGLTAYALLNDVLLNSGDVLVLNAANSSLAHLIIQLALIKEIKVIALVDKIDPQNIINNEVVFIEQGDPLLVNKIKEITKDKGINGYLDAVGGTIVSKLFPLMAPYSNIIVYGRYSFESSAYFNSDIIYRNLTIKEFGIDYWKQMNKNLIDTAYNELINGFASSKLKWKNVEAISFDHFLNKIKNGEKKKMIIIKD